MITYIVIALALFAVGVLYLAVRSRRIQAARTVRPLNLKAFRTLTERDDENFLRQKLPRSEFSRLKRERVGVTMRYVGRIAGNASVVMRLAETARGSADPEVAKTAAQVMETATQIRIQCLVAMAKLSVEFAMPSLQLTPAMLEPKYRTLRENFAQLGRLQIRSAAPAAVAI